MSKKHKLSEVEIHEAAKIRNALKFYRDEEGTLFVELPHRIGSYEDDCIWRYFYACEFHNGELVILQYVLRKEVDLEPDRSYRDDRSWGDPWYLPKKGMRGGPESFSFHEDDVEVVPDV